MIGGLFGGEKEPKEVEEENIPSEELCEKCGEQRSEWKVVDEEIKICNSCVSRDKRHLVRI